jgi:hypothetical protein
MRHWVTLVARLANPKKIHMNQRVNHEPPGFQAGATALNPRLAHPCHKPARPYVMSCMEADMTRIPATLVGALMAGNGIIMVVDPPAWYASVPGVADTGPLNLHFVRDIGFAYFTAGSALVWGAFGGGWKVSATGTLFFALHAALHAVERLGGHHHGDLVGDLVAIHLPTAIAAGVTWIQFRAATEGRTT